MLSNETSSEAAARILYAYIKKNEFEHRSNSPNSSFLAVLVMLACASGRQPRAFLRLNRAQAKDRLPMTGSRYSARPAYPLQLKYRNRKNEEVDCSRPHVGHSLHCSVGLRKFSAWRKMFASAYPAVVRIAHPLSGCLAPRAFATRFTRDV